MPVAPPRSLISGKPMKMSWSANWDDDLGGSPEILHGDPILTKVSEEVQLRARTDLHVLPAAHLRALPEPVLRGGVPVGRDVQAREDGIVLVDQERCRGWRMCVSGCPYKKVYFNH